MKQSFTVCQVFKCIIHNFLKVTLIPTEEAHYAIPKQWFIPLLTMLFQCNISKTEHIINSKQYVNAFFPEPEQFLVGHFWIILFISRAQNVIIWDNSLVLETLFWVPDFRHFDFVLLWLRWGKLHCVCVLETANKILIAAHRPCYLYITQSGGLLKELAFLGQWPWKV